MVELLNEGIDTVKSNASYYLTDNIENLTLTDGTANGGFAFISGYGNNLNNVMIGNEAKNTLIGYGGNDLLIGNGGNDYFIGGLGNDTLIGGTGREAYELSSPLGADNVDYIQGFNTTEGDHLHLDFSIFSAFSSNNLGDISYTELRFGTSAQDADDYFIFNKANGYLYYDSDGNGSSTQQLIAVITGLVGEFTERNMEIVDANGIIGV